MPMTVAELLTLTKSELDDLYFANEAGPVPNGEADGTAIIAAGTIRTAQIADVVKRFLWKGKIFDAPTGKLRNRILPNGLEEIAADVSVGPSWLDQRDCIIIDYSKTSLVAHWIRDEIRLISPGLYLGQVFWAHDRLIHFALRF